MSTVISHVDCMYVPWVWCQEIGTFLLVIFSKPHYTNLIMRQTRQILTEVHFAKCLTTPPQDSRGLQKQGNFENLSQSRDVTSKCKMVPCAGSWNRKRVLGENQGNLDRVGMLVNNNASVVIPKVGQIHPNNVKMFEWYPRAPYYLHGSSLNHYVVGLLRRCSLVY